MGGIAQNKLQLSQLKSKENNYLFLAVKVCTLEYLVGRFSNKTII
jgi:hypothetical protein